MADPLFAPIFINSLEVGNRIYMPAMHLNMCRNYRVTEQLLAFYAERAAGGAGMICVGYASVDPLSANPMHIGAHDDDFLPGLTELADTIKSHGGRAAVQLNHAGRYNHSMLLGGKKPVGPSPVPSKLTGETPQEMSREQIAGTISSFADAARRVQRAGFDAVEILCGTGYLISSFLSPLTNCRHDGYGGSPENRMRFGFEVIGAVRAAVGDDFPIIARVNGNDFMPDGIGPEEMAAFVQVLETAGVDAFGVNVGWHESRIPQIQTKVPRGVYAYLARNIREKVNAPVIASHRINDPPVARQLINEGSCDMVAMGRALIADPQLPEKTRSGRESEIIHCVACGQGCFDNLMKMRSVECLCNPRAGHEYRIKNETIADAKHLLVVGGGVAGMSAALAASGRGHRVTLVEKSNRLGGQLELAGAPPGRGEFVQLLGDLTRQVDCHEIDIRLETEADMKLISGFKPDMVVLATGGTSIKPPIPGSGLGHVVQAWDVLSGNAEVGEKVVIIGGGAVGVETALMLAEKGTISAETLKFLLVHRAVDFEELYRLSTRGRHQVMILEMQDKLGANFGKTTRWTMLDDMKRYGVDSALNARVVEITAAGVNVDATDGVKSIPADTVVLAVGTRAHNPLQADLEQAGWPVHVVGDASHPAMVIDAVHQGYAAGWRI